jgi:hypothetical protein
MMQPGYVQFGMISSWVKVTIIVGIGCTRSTASPGHCGYRSGVDAV